ncbi:4-hydroxy-tetrahydrodipicolinate reductase [Candidatus Finniella inopinata]|uniref:4-hydroxy-tetrahydrodipicolinate reductase n=1 Tax=Candidatus Finniella inopinata TaxID=1696036 RepID=A0A4V2DZT7_9PROT|nr:4-hydroxy-tetrahydrodipicolinate reductase [Candidatus Finniella inopinata]RZI46197.1 4-hydroxy-tetrahydrodipicolinate reductase [Candidatus Finniella inopinata]
MKKIKLGLLGTGRMGNGIIEYLREDGPFVIGAVASRGDLRPLFEQSDVIIDFSQPQGTQPLLDRALDFNKPLVIGTTGLTDDQVHQMEKIAKTVPVVYARNTSIGITLMQAVVKQLTKALGDDFDVELSETHHRHKVDAPSGTCLMLAEAVASARGVDLKDVARFERHGHVGARVPGEIGFSVRRGGQYPGEHTVSFLSDEESIEITHRSFSRQLFVKGALKAAQWVIHQPPGLYGMADVLGF